MSNEQPLPPYSRTPVDTEPPPERLPPYSEAVRWVAHNSLRPGFILSQLVCLIVCISLAISSFGAVDSNYPNQYNNLMYVAGAIQIVCAITFLTGVFAGSSGRPFMLKVFEYICAPAMVAVLASQVLCIAADYGNKKKVVDSCTDELVRDNSGLSYASDLQDEAHASCHSTWQSQTVWDIVWLVLILLFGTFFAFLAYRYFRRVDKPDAAEIAPQAEAPPVQASPQEANSYSMTPMGRSMNYPGEDQFYEYDETDEKGLDSKRDFAEVPEEQPAWAGPAASTSMRPSAIH